jgi:hypothetical protein
MDADGGIPIPEYMRTWGRWGGPVEDKPLSELGLENGEYI